MKAILLLLLVGCHTSTSGLTHWPSDARQSETAFVEAMPRQEAGIKVVVQPDAGGHGH